MWLTDLPLMPHVCVSESGQHWFRYGLVAYLAPSHYLNQCWVIVNWTPENKFQWNLNRNFSFEKMHLKLLFAKMAAILSRGRWVKLAQVILENLYWNHFCRSWLSHQMKTFSALLALCAGNSPVTSRALMFSLIRAWTNNWQTMEMPVIWDAIALIMTSL